MLFKREFHQAIKSGAITVTYRAWQRVRVKVGNRYRLDPDGVLEVDEVREMPVAEITEAAARGCGFASRDGLIRQLIPVDADDCATVFEVRFRYLHDPRAVAVDVSADVTEDALRGLSTRLRNMDARSRSGPWTGATLALIDAYPRVAASCLAPRLGMETAPFKRNVRKLKALGLTISHDVGYTLTSLGARVHRDGTASVPG
ncbi:MAG: hypothetical protein OXC12_20150 [Spirochaetaceae bacterium]|nr:hypothetical protein [Spirochaetaceae bacterium]